jgi:hypothetical protein
VDGPLLFRKGERAKIGALQQRIDKRYRNDADENGNGVEDAAKTPPPFPLRIVKNGLG